MWLFWFRFDKTLSAKKPAFLSNSNKMNLVEKKDSKQKNAIHQDCQKIQSNSSTVKAEDTLSKAWHHITAQFVYTLFTHLHGGRHSRRHLSESLVIIFSSHFPVGFDFTKTTQPERARSVLLHGHNGYKILNNLASTSQRQVLVLKPPGEPLHVHYITTGLTVWTCCA